MQHISYLNDKLLEKPLALMRETGTPIESGFIRVRFRNISHHRPESGLERWESKNIKMKLKGIFS